MKYSYVSYWRAVEANRFKLRGVIVAGPGELDAYFPDPEEAAEWSEVKRQWQETRDTQAPLEWLRQLPGSGNGVTDEYDEVRSVKASSLAEAMRKAYDQTVKDRGLEVPAYTEMPGTVQDVHDPLAGMFPDT